MLRQAMYAAAVLALAPSVAFAGSTDPNHPTPGDGYRIPVIQRTSGQPLAAYPVNPGVPGDGYRIAVVPRMSRQPLAGLPR